VASGEFHQAVDGIAEGEHGEGEGGVCSRAMPEERLCSISERYLATGSAGICLAIVELRYHLIKVQARRGRKRGEMPG